MKLSIATKLGFGFGAIILLMIVSAGIAYFNLSRMNCAVTDVVDEAMPTVRSCERLLNAVNESLAALRGYLILGETPQNAKALKAQRAASWRELDTHLVTLDGYLQRWDDRLVAETLSDVKQTLRELRDAQQRIEETAYTDENIRAFNVLFTEAAPRAAEVVTCLTTMIEHEKTQEASQQRRTLLAALADSRGSFALGLASIRAFLLSGKTEFKDAFDTHWAVNTARFETLDSYTAAMTPLQRQQWDRYVSLRGEFGPLPPRMFALREMKDWNQAEYLLETAAAPRVQTLKEAFATIISAAETRQKQSRAQLDLAAKTVSMSLLLATFAGIGIGSIVAVVLSRKIVAMLRALAARANEISEGDLTGNELLIKSSDELGQLANGFDAMFGNLKDLTSQILSVTENVNSATAQISSSAKQQACSTKEQAATVQEITSTMQEIAQSGCQIVEKAKEVAVAAEATARQSKSGIAAVQNTSRTMESIREQVEQVAENIVALSEKTQAVGEIVSTVNDIAEQSNLLALNATIEAVDAGEEGNRFSVVANEMKNLADQAKECTVQVRNILGEIQKGINSAVMLTEEAVKRVEAGKQHAEISEETIRKMSETTAESVQAFQQIIGATNQQQVGVDQVSKGMQDIDQATQQTATGTAQLEQAVVSLSAMSQQLKSAVGVYRIQA